METFRTARLIENILKSKILDNCFSIDYTLGMEIGIDIEENERFKNISETFISHTYTENEILHARKAVNSYERWCALWCAKEAVIKAFSNKGLRLKEIEIVCEDNGKPKIVRNKMIEDELKKLGASEIKISISHSKNYSTAVCLVY